MSTEDTTAEEDNVSICANCGKGEEESDKLKACTACKLVKYCSRECQIAHRPQHKKECRKRAAELHDIELFKQPPPEEECPICFLQLPTLHTGWVYMSCCGKEICSGCAHAPLFDNQGNKVDNTKCAFCRTPAPTSEEELIEREWKRAEDGDSQAIYNLGYFYNEGFYGLRQDYTKALELLHRAGNLGSTEAYKFIGFAYLQGRGVEVDKKKANHYNELAAIGGDSEARHNLGTMEGEAGNHDRAMKHYMIAARSGNTVSLKTIKQMYSNGYVTKEDYTKALQSYQTYLGEVKSKQRDEAAAADEENRYY